MNTSELPPQLALRIALAARSLPALTLPQFVDILIADLGLPLTEDRLARARPGTLRAAAGGLLARTPRSAMREALGYLQGHTRIEIIGDEPPLPFEHDEAVPNALRIAVARDHGEYIDGDFARCAGFLIYQVSASAIRLVDWRAAPQGKMKSVCLMQRVELLEDCHMVYARSLNTPTSARLMAKGIHPLRCPGNTPAREQLRALQQVLNSHPAPWLARAMGSAPVLPGRLGMDGPVLIHSSRAKPLSFRV